MKNYVINLFVGSLFAFSLQGHTSTLDSHCYSEAQASVLSTISSHEVLGLNLRTALVKSIKIESIESTVRFEVQAESSYPLDNSGVRNYSTKWLVEASRDSCEELTVILSDSSYIDARP